MTRSHTLNTLAGLLLLLRNEWSPDGEPVTLTLRGEIAHEIAAALEITLPVLEQAPEEWWKEATDEL